MNPFKLFREGVWHDMKIPFDTATYLARKTTHLFLWFSENHYDYSTWRVNPPIHYFFLAQNSQKEFTLRPLRLEVSTHLFIIWRRSLRESTQNITDPYARSTYSSIFIRAICTAPYADLYVIFHFI